MKFNEIPYKRPDLTVISAEINELADKLEQCNEPTEFKEIFNNINKYFIHIDTMSSLASVRNSIDASDEFYDDEMKWWDENSPYVEQLTNRVARIALSKDYRDQLTDEIYETYFQIAECAVKCFDEKIIPLLQEENKYVTEYNKLKASAKIEFEGKIYNLPQIAAITESENREIRKNASKALSDFYETNEEQFDEIYDNLVKVRTKIANELGFDNYVELGYLRMQRLDYNQDMVANYRKQILEEVTPVVSKIYDKQKEMIGIEDLQYYDLNYRFKSGNPIPHASYDEMIEAARDMYHNMSEETKEFIDVMIDNELWDLQSKPNKQTGGYCTSFLEYKYPFIFSNFNGTSGDVDVLTHEAGHAFMCYMARDINIPSCMWPTMEACEIHSMSMEFFAYPYIKNFFKEDTEKYYYSHLSGTLIFLPYGVLVDHFQHEVYKHPEMTKEERKATWRKLEKMYLPFKKYDDNPMLEKGTWWYRQSHIFQTPFYYIDYTLAQVCALQFWDRVYHNDSEAWNDYLKLCKLGGTKSFLKLLASCNLKSPFEDGCLTEVVNDATEYLNGFDTTKF